MHGAFVLFGIVLVGRAAQVQLFQTSRWRAKARSQQMAASPLPAPRGMILDESGAMLVESRQLVRLNVAPREVVGDLKKKPADGKRRLAALANALANARVSPEVWPRVRRHDQELGDDPRPLPAERRRADRRDARRPLGVRCSSACRRRTTGFAGSSAARTMPASRSTASRRRSIPCCAARPGTPRFSGT